MKWLIICFLIFSFETSFSQRIDNTNRQSNSNIYNDAIARFLDGFYKPEIKVADTVYIEINELTDSIIQQIDGTTIIRLDAKAMADYLENHTSLLFSKIIPLQLNNGEFSVSIEMLKVHCSKEKKAKHFSGLGRETFVYKFENNQFIFLRKDYLYF